MATSNSRGRRSTGASGRRRRRRRGSGITAPKIVAFVLILIVIVAAVFGVTRLLKSAFGEKSPTTTAAQAKETTTVPESELTAQVSVDGVNITGMSESEARTAIMRKYDWNMTVRFDDSEKGTFALSNLIDRSIDSVLDDIYAKKKPDTDYTIIFSADEDRLASDLSEMEHMWNKAAKNGAISGYSKESNSFTYSGEEPGVAIDSEKLKKDIEDAVASKKFSAKIDVSTTVVEPEISAAKAKELYKTIGTFTTNTTANPARNNNIKLAAQAVDGTILEVGETFSFNLCTGNRTTEKGYQPAGAYQNGVLVEEPGGGVCQVSSTLYHAVIYSGLTTVERHAHTFEPSYVTPGEDATVSYDGYAGPDLKFVNSSSSAIAIRASYSNQTVTCSIIGIPILEEGETIRMSSHKTAEYDVPAPVYEEDPMLQPHEEVVVSEGDHGSAWTTNLIRKKNGEVVSDEFFHTSIYKGHSPKIRRNSTDIAPPTSEAESSESPQETVEYGPGGGPGVSGTNASPASTTAASPAGTTAASPASQATEAGGPAEPVSPPETTAAAEPTAAPAPAPASPAGQGGAPSSPTAEAPVHETVEPHPGF